MTTAVRHHRRLRELVLAVRVRHYEPIDQVRWHVHVQLAAISDPNFGAPLVDKRTDQNAGDFRYRSDEVDAGGQTAAFDANGELTTLSKASDDDRVGTAFCAPGSVPAGVERGRTYWLRSRQKPVGGDWGDWATETRVVI